MLNITDQEVLNKVIELQRSIIDGVRLKNILEENIDFLLTESQSDTIIIYMHEHEYVKPEYILIKQHNLDHLFKKYIFSKKKCKWIRFVENCNTYFTYGPHYEKFTDLYQIFKGFLTKKEAASFTKEMQIKSAIIFPVLTSKDKDIIGYISYVFQKEIEIDIEKINNITRLLQTLLQPLYDQEHHTMCSKCIKVDEEMNLLTTQEKKIIKEVLNGKTYIDIADMFNISINTIKKHIVNIFNKYNVNSKVELFNRFYTQLDQ